MLSAELSNWIGTEQSLHQVDHYACPYCRCARRFDLDSNVTQRWVRKPFRTFSPSEPQCRAGVSGSSPLSFGFPDPQPRRRRLVAPAPRRRYDLPILTTDGPTDPPGPRAERSPAPAPRRPAPEAGARRPLRCRGVQIDGRRLAEVSLGSCSPLLSCSSWCSQWSRAQERPDRRAPQPGRRRRGPRDVVPGAPRERQRGPAPRAAVPTRPTGTAKRELPGTALHAPGSSSTPSLCPRIRRRLTVSVVDTEHSSASVFILPAALFRPGRHHRRGAAATAREAGEAGATPMPRSEQLTRPPDQGPGGQSQAGQASVDFV